MSGDTVKGFRFIQVSTDEVYGSLTTEGNSQNKLPITPAHHIRHLKPAQTTLHNHGMRLIISRSHY